MNVASPFIGVKRSSFFVKLLLTRKVYDGFFDLRTENAAGLHYYPKLERLERYN